MKRGGWIVLGLLLIGAVGAFVWYQRLTDGANHKADGTSSLKPRLALGSFQITDIAEDRIKLTTKLLIDNPLPVAFKARQVDYTFYIADTPVMEDSYRKTIEIESGDSTLITMPATLIVDKLAQVLKTLDEKGIDSTTYKIRATFQMDVPILGERTFAVTTEKRLPTFYIPEIKIKDLDIGKFSLKATDLATNVEISNRNGFPLNITDTRYSVKIDNDMIAEGVQPEPILIKERAVTPVVFPVTIRPGKLDNVAWKALFEKEKTPYLVLFSGKIIDKSGNGMFENSGFSTQVKGTLADLKKLGGNVSKEEKKENRQEKREERREERREKKEARH